METTDSGSINKHQYYMFFMSKQYLNLYFPFSGSFRRRWQTGKVYFISHRRKIEVVFAGLAVRGHQAFKWLVNVMLLRCEFESTILELQLQLTKLYLKYTWFFVYINYSKRFLLNELLYTRPYTKRVCTAAAKQMPPHR